MDPEATIQQLTDALRSEDYAKAVTLVAAYYQWRLRGGFEPENGDSRIETIVNQLAETLED